MNYFLPHIGEDNYLNKAYFIGFMVNKLLRVYVERLLKEMGAKKICSYIHKDNTSSLKSSRKSGSIVEYYKTTKKLL